LEGVLPESAEGEADRSVFEGTDVAYSFEITLSCSIPVEGTPSPVSIRLIALNQSLVYAWQLEGLPTEEENQRIIEGAVRDAKKAFGSTKPFLIAPKQEPLKGFKKYPFGKPAIIPGIRCIAFFLCDFPTQDNRGDYSSMTVVWFQKEFAMPINGKVLEKIRVIDWLNLAENSKW
jgi:hypothetical protein